MIHLKQRKGLLKKLRRLMPSSVVCFCCRKVNTKSGDENYEEKSIMYGIGSDYATDNNGIGNGKTLVAQ